MHWCSRGQKFTLIQVLTPDWWKVAWIAACFYIPFFLHFLSILVREQVVQGNLHIYVIALTPPFMASVLQFGKKKVHPPPLTKGKVLYL